MPGHIYIPGLARPGLPAAPAIANDFDAFARRVESAFGYLEKSATPYSRVCHRFSDAFMDGAITALHTRNGAQPVDCGRTLQWVRMSFGGVKGKAARLLGGPGENLLAVRAGPMGPNPMKRIALNVQVTPPCNAAEWLAQSRPQAGRAPARALAHVRAREVLYLVGHGNPTGASMTFKVAPLPNHAVAGPANHGGTVDGCEQTEHLERWHVDAVTLAALLEDEGLPRDHRDLELVMCFAAGVSVANEQTVQPFAQRLAGALGASGYRNIRVKGALGLVIGPTLAVAPGAVAGAEAIVIDVHARVLPDAPAYRGLFRIFRR